MNINAIPNTSVAILAKNFRNERRERQLSQQHLAKHLGVSQAQVSLLERGRLALPVTAALTDELFSYELRETRTPGGQERVGWVK